MNCNTLTRIRLFLIVTTLLIPIRAAIATEPTKPRDVTFLVTSDSHYAAFDKEDRNKRDHDTLLAMNDVTSLTWPQKTGGGSIARPRGVILLGDVIDDGDTLRNGKRVSQRQWLFFAADFGLDGADGVLDYPVFETWGNHDGPPEGKEKHGFSFRAKLKERNQIRMQKGLVTNLSANKLFYSWDWDDVHFVTLGIYGANVQNAKVKYSPVWHDPQGALDFLKDDLKRFVGDSGRPVVLLSHCGFDTDWWHPDDWRTLYDAVKPYNVILVMYGHSGTGLREWAPDKDQKPLQCVNTGQTENGFFILQINGDRVRGAYRAKRYTEEKLPDGKTKRNWDGTWGWRHVLDTSFTSSTSRGRAASR